MAQQKRLSPTEPPPPQTCRSPQPYARSAHTNDFNVFRQRRSTSVGPTAPFPRRPCAHSSPGTVSSFKASIHSNPYLASRCRTLKSQTAYLKEKLEELIASVEELQPDQTAMDWAASAGTIIYVPVHVNRDNEAPQATPAHPEARGPEGSMFPNSLPHSKKTDSCLVGNAGGLSAGMSYRQTRPQPQLGQPSWTSPFSISPFSSANIGRPLATATSMDACQTAGPLFATETRSADESTRPRHAYVEDSTREESRNSGM